MELKKRIEWIDIYKAIAISLVVIGHSTGKYNGYIYQFHVAAFFFISGYVAKLDENSLGKNIYKNFSTLIVPLFTISLIMDFALKGLEFLKVYSIFYQENLCPSVSRLIRSFVTSGSMVDLLGAAWFLWALFFAAVLSQIIYIICKKNIILFVSATTLVYLYGYYNMTTGNRLPYRSDIALFVQGFYGLGFAIKKLMVGKEIKTSNKYIFFQTSLAIVTSLNMYLMKTFLQGKALMDIANRWVSNPGWGTFAALNGIIWLSVISQLISKINNVKIKKIFLIVGRSTMGIMLLHFAFFRIVSFVLAIVGVVSIEECQNLVPSTEIGNRYWWIYYLSAIVGSIFVWNKSISIPGLKQLLGFDREFTRSIAQLRPIREMFEIYNDVGRGMRGAGNQLKSMMREQTAGNVFRKVALVGVLMILIASRYVPSYDVYARASDTQGTEDYNDNIIESKEITFPYNGNAVWFEEGWLEQTKDEQYRWVSKESEFSIELSNQTNIKMIGYIPNEIVGMNKVELYLNNNLVAEQKALAGQEIIIEVDISDKEIQGKNTFKLCFDGERNPAPDDADQRIFSAMFTSILVE